MGLRAVGDEREHTLTANHEEGTAGLEQFSTFIGFTEDEAALELDDGELPAAFRREQNLER